MPFNGVGVFQRVYQWVNDASNNIFVDATRTDQDSNDIADGLTNCITRDGQSTVLANLPMGTFKLTGLGVGQNPADSVNYGQVFNNPGYTNGLTVTGGVVSLTGASSVTVPTVAVTDSSNNAASTFYVTQKAFAAALPGQSAATAGMFPQSQGASGTVLWAFAQSLVRSARTANALLVAADRGVFVDITAGTFTQTFDAPATLGNGWYCVIRNNGSGNITIPASDGRTNWIMYPGECRWFTCDGTAFYSIVMTAYKLISQISGTWIKPPGYNYHRERLTGSGAGGGGGGGGGNGSPNSLANGLGGAGASGGAGGSPGVTVEIIIADSVLPTSVPYTIGAAGTGGNGGAGGAASAAGIGSGNSGVNGNAGAVGNPSVFGTPGNIWYVTVPGGATGGPSGNFGSAGNTPGTSVTNTSTTIFSCTAYGAYSLPTPAPGSSSAGTAGTFNTSIGPSGAGGNAGTGGISALIATAPAGGTGGASTSSLGAAGNNGTAAAVTTTAGAGGGGGGGGGGSAGCGSTTAAATGKGGDGGRGADGGPGQLEISGII